ncbi:MAG: hypothetical protein SFU53_13440 [Terrimicrobiaceae bacterium]|nr:hypothetical protein [Terrimicrobiaceae bacterium]
MTYKTYLLDLSAVPVKDAAGNPISDPVGTHLTRNMASKPELTGFRLASAHETTVPGQPGAFLRLVFEKA